MTKLRAPLSIDAALARIAGQDGVGGWAGMAQATGYHERTVRGWGDPDRDEQPPLTACVTLGILYRQSGGVGDPLLQAHADMVGGSDAAAFADKHELRRESISFIRETGDASLALLEAAEPDAGEAENARASKEVLDVRNWADRILARLGRKPP
ncbi:hypothetical protein SAMN05518849_101572 [Sphingobium sp. AP50]|uniref:hypothetical protein n=1 Tax=Sphingobium sp. AP50 TaxID=1884369 RepID=UPI0008C146FA|nr:hypothetical protein [Sphingobium sp. AP50]SEI69136.1 hypothetical protein SAMN05518849_101572 [Sphingobium sp. AP50]